MLSPSVASPTKHQSKNADGKKCQQSERRKSKVQREKILMGENIELEKKATGNNIVGKRGQ
jgi:hypothetical protein